ncbi:MAG: sulfite exporter TauE/SafE family protein [Deltaproteobacteria bacterium]|nr:sulfite exporter TauE/SafE family protein [Deltaproteobacteria bacterium]
MDINLFYLAPLFFLTALTYSMVGLGGGSTYLALLALFAVSYSSIPQIALLCNLVVVVGGYWFFWKAGHFSLRRVLPFIVTSIPMATWGGSIPIEKKVFMLLLGLSLGVAALRMLLSDKVFESRFPLSWKRAWAVGIPVGALLGFLSGLVGIGGGIYLAPVLLLLGWADSKQAAAAASFFILVNSIAGFGGQLMKGGFMISWGMVLPLLFAVFLGGQIGSRLGSQTIPKLALQRVTAILILAVVARLLIQAPH